MNRYVYGIIEEWPGHKEEIFLIPASRGYSFHGGAAMNQEGHDFTMKRILSRIGIKVKSLNSEDLIFHGKDRDKDLFFYRVLFDKSDSDSAFLGKFFNFGEVFSILPVFLSKPFEEYFSLRSEWNNFIGKGGLNWLEPVLEKFPK